MDRKRRDVKDTKLYKSPYEAYPFLADPPEDLRCDFELMTDEMASLTGLLAAVLKEDQSALRRELEKIEELIYHANPTLRTRMTVTAEEVDWLSKRVRKLTRPAADGSPFVLPRGCEGACIAHLLRVKAKELVRLLYRCACQGNDVPDLLLDFSNLLSGYFFGLSLLLNQEKGVEEKEFVSRNYGIGLRKRE